MRTFEENKRTFTGCSVSAMCLTLEGLGVDALGVNCSLGPADLLPIVEEIARWTSLPIIVKPNAGLPDPETNTYNVMPDEFAGICKKMLAFGAKIFGGCCGTNPAYIGKLKEMLEGASKKDLFRKQTPDTTLSVCTPLTTVTVSEPRVIGERINPTGKKRFREALAAGDMDYILGQAFSQIEAGADLLDVNVGAPGIDEKDMMVRTVKALQSVGFDTIACGDSYNDLGMIRASKAGFLFRSTEQIRRDNPDLEAFEDFDDLLNAIKKAL
jgi:5-methyltetrahydrofolate--homocysteine methyltransferase